MSRRDMVRRERHLTGLQRHELIRWDAGLCRSFVVGSFAVFVRPAAAQEPGRPLRVDVAWAPNKPARLSPELISAFDRQMRTVRAELAAELEQLRRPR